MSEAGWPDEFRKGRSFEALGQEVASAAIVGGDFPLPLTVFLALNSRCLLKARMVTRP